MKKKNKERKVPKRYFRNERLRISQILIEETLGWKSTTKVSDEEFMRLVDKLYCLLKRVKRKNIEE